VALQESAHAGRSAEVAAIPEQQAWDEQGAPAVATMGLRDEIGAGRPLQVVVQAGRLPCREGGQLRAPQLRAKWIRGSTRATRKPSSNADGAGLRR
jgi:hypothetical protein